MNFLLDTNVISEPTKPRPNKGVMAWLAAVNEDSVFLSVVTITELRYGIERLTAGKHRRRLDEWLRGELTARFQGRILPIDVDVADACRQTCGAQRISWPTHGATRRIHRCHRGGSRAHTGYSECF